MVIHLKFSGFPWGIPPLSSSPRNPLFEFPFLIVDLVEMGKVRYIGASSMYAYQFVGLQHVADKNGWTKFISMQNQYHLIYREEEREMIPACKELGVGYEIPTFQNLIKDVFRGGLLRGDFSLVLKIKRPLDLPIRSSRASPARRNGQTTGPRSSIASRNSPKRRA
jgi:Aldo/keto reductase family